MFTIIAIIMTSESEPVSPMKIFAGGALYQRNPKQAPTIDPQKLKQHQEYIEFVNIQRKLCFNYI